MLWLRKTELERTISETVTRIVKSAFDRVDTEVSKLYKISDLSGKVTELKEEIETLRIEKGRVEEDRAKERRELEHKIGLHKQQITQDIVLARREASVEVKEANLNADRKRFEEQMKFVQENFTAQTEYLKDIIGDLSKRLPSLDMTADVTPKKR